MGFSNSTGMVRGVTGTLTLDGADPARSTIEASFPLSALQTVSATLDGHIMGKDFFDDAAPDTAITFKSTAVEPTGDMTANVTGDLTLNGQTRPVTLEVELRQVAVDPVSNVPTAGFRATGTIKRSDFGLGVDRDLDLVGHRRGEGAEAEIRTLDGCLLYTSDAADE